MLDGNLALTDMKVPSLALPGRRPQLGRYAPLD